MTPLFRAGLVDELHLTICPKIFGGRRAPTIADGLGAKKLSARRARAKIRTSVWGRVVPGLSQEKQISARALRGGSQLPDELRAVSDARASNQSKSERRLR